MMCSEYREMKSRPLTAQQLLSDTESEYIAAIYRFRKAEEQKSAEYNEARCEVNRLEKRLLWIRECIYRNKPHLLFQKERANIIHKTCPEPQWDSEGIVGES